MSDNPSQNLSRRTFFFMSGAAAAATTLSRVARAQQPSANDKLNVASIGCGGKGASDLTSIVLDQENVAALCDVDWNRAANSFKRYPNAKKYKDYREMLDKEHKNIDAVIVSTPDHMHAVAALAAMQLGKHVYVQKPLTHNIHEADVLLQAAQQYGVVTQMGNQGKSSDGVRRVCEWIWAGAIGQVREVHMWTDRFKSHVDSGWIQGISEPLPEEPIPDHMAWDLWLGCAPARPYNHGYAPFAWRGWWDFGCGALGDMGCHIMNAAFWSLDLALPSSVECIHQKDKNGQTGPSEAIVRYDFPARYNRYGQQNMGPVKAFWYESGLLPDRPEGVSAGETLGDGKNGTIFIGEKGVLTCGSHGNDPRLLPASEMEARKEELDKIPETLERIPNSTDGHYRDFALACKNGGRSNGDFEYSVPLTKMVTLGNVAMRVGEKIEWDGQAMRALNDVNAQPYLSRDYREGYSLEL